jgi:hypothetical protein
MSCGGSMKKMRKGGYPVKNFINNNLKPLFKIPRYPGDTYKKDTGRNISEKAAARKVAKGKGFMTYQSNYKSDPEGTGDNKGIFNSNFIGRKPRIVMQKGGSKLEKQKIGGMVKKMAVGGTTTKRIIKKSTGGMYGIPQENLGTSGQYGFAKKGGAVKMKKGRATKAAKFAALAPPYNKATFADKIAGAKKSVKKKK